MLIPGCEVVLSDEIYSVPLRPTRLASFIQNPLTLARVREINREIGTSSTCFQRKKRRSSHDCFSHHHAGFGCRRNIWIVWTTARTDNFPRLRVK
jgi:hypothetical protein